MFDNLKIGKKMLLLSGTILCLLLAVLVVGMYGLSRTVKDGQRVSAGEQLKADLAELEIDHLTWISHVAKFLNDDNGSELDVQIDPHQSSFGKWYYGEERQKAERLIPDLRSNLQAIEQPYAALYASAKQIRLKGRQEARVIFNKETHKALQEVQKQLTEMREKVSTHAEGLIEETAADIKSQNITVISVGIIALILGALLAILISRSLTGPIRKIVEVLEELENGHLGELLKLDRNDEIGQIAKSLDAVTDFFQYELLAMTNKMSDGDLTFEITPRDDQDLVRGSLQKLATDLNEIMGQIQIAGNEISSASGEIADSSQDLSQGATESAASLEEISASLNQTSSQTTLNAENAAQANSLSTETKQAAEKGSEQMQKMVTAMTEISEESQKISKIIKTIDEIAFQTNLLALNAAVEAARAGQHGKGFAVVAEEVRNLAARSAKAAAETSELIEGSVEKTANGTTIANQTAEALEGIVSGVSKVTDLVAEISAASNEQAQGVAEINIGVTQIDTVTQRNTASAEESAAAAEELSAQAAQLRSMLQRFKLKQGQSIASPVVQTDSFASTRSQPNSSGWGGIEEKQNTAIKPPEQITLDDSNFGKY
ncbi:MAG: methyl-accepting chemotaxis protein [Desulfuromusa sp.]|nr:methyl-accepting chemotaxis protein [Desulfuromusa sp.]